MIKKYPKYAVCVKKMQNLMLVSVEKVKVCDLYLLLGELVCIFFQRIRTQHRILRFMIPIWKFATIFFAFCQLSSQTRPNRLKKRKTFLINMFWNFILREASICKKSQNRCNLIYSIFKCLLLFTRYSFVLPYIFYLVENVKLL